MKQASHTLVIFAVVTAVVSVEGNVGANWISEQNSNSHLSPLFLENDRHLQNSVNCAFKAHGRALTCTEQTPNGNDVRYSVTCPEGVTTVEACLEDQQRICYQFNTLPCIGSFFCDSTSRFSLDCGNLFARSNDNTCSKTDCDGNCSELRDIPVNYNTVDLDNDCLRLGLSSTVSTAGVVTTEWTHVLSNGSTEIQVTGTRSSSNNVFETCQVTVAGQAGSSCPCSVACPALTSTISYDCTDFTTDACAAIDCSGNCVPGGSVVTPPVTAPVAPPVQPPVTAPVAPPVTAPVAPPVQPPVTAPVAPPVQPPVTAPVAPPVQPPVTAPVAPPVQPPVTAPVAPPVQPPIPVVAPVQPPVTAPVAPPVQPPVTAPVAQPVQPPVSAPITPPVQPPIPVVAPVSPPVLSPVSIVTSPPMMAPVVMPSNGPTTCELWWGLY